MDPAEMKRCARNYVSSSVWKAPFWSSTASFLWNGLLHFDFGPSLMSYPEPVNNIIGRNLPYTLGLSLTSTLVAWIIGNIVGLLAGFRPKKRS